MRSTPPLQIWDEPCDRDWRSSGPGTSRKLPLSSRGTTHHPDRALPARLCAVGTHESAPAAPTPWHRSRPWTTARWAAVLLLSVSISVVAVQGAAARDPWLQVCATDLANVGTVAAVRVCRAPSVADPVFLGPLILIVLLLLPDVTRIGIAGVLELERTVSEQKVRTENLENSVATLTAQLTQHQFSQQTVNLTMNHTQDVLPPEADLTDLVSRVEDSAARFRSGADGV